MLCMCFVLSQLRYAFSRYSVLACVWEKAYVFTKLIYFAILNRCLQTEPRDTKWNISLFFAIGSIRRTQKSGMTVTNPCSPYVRTHFFLFSLSTTFVAANATTVRVHGDIQSGVSVGIIMKLPTETYSTPHESEKSFNNVIHIIPWLPHTPESIRI